MQAEKVKRVGELGTNVVCSTVRLSPLVNQTTALDSPELISLSSSFPQLIIYANGKVH